MPDRQTNAINLAPGQGETRNNPAGGPLTFKARGGQTGGTLTAFETVAAPGEGPPLHVHPDQDESMYVLDGTVRFKLGDSLEPAPAGGFVYIPRGLPHAWQNVGEAPARMLILFTPAAPGMEAFFDRFDALPNDVSVPEAFRSIASETGMQVVGPLLADSDPR